MAKQLFNSRNQAVKDYFSALAKKHPEWRIDALEQNTGKKFFITPRTVRAILKEHGVYCNAS